MSDSSGGESGAASSSQRSKKGEDYVMSQRALIGGDDVLFMLVADGHGGPTAAELIHEHMITYIIAEAEDDASADSLQAACAYSFERMHKHVCSVSDTSGSTLTVVAVNFSRRELTVANVGDSEALLVEAEDETLLTTQHRLADSAEERERVVETGSTIAQAVDNDGYPGGPLRAYPGGLAVTRTIGDADCPSACAVPAVHTVAFDADAGAAIIICSDGVWDACSHAKVGSCVRRARTAAAASDRIVATAIKAAGLRDDTSALVAWLGVPPWDESVYESTSTATRLGRRLSLAFGSRSPSCSPKASRNATPQMAPAPSHKDLAGLGGIPSLNLDAAGSPSSSPSSSREPSLTGAVVFKVGL